MKVISASKDYGRNTLLIIFDGEYTDIELREFLRNNYPSFVTDGYTVDVDPGDYRNRGSVYVMGDTNATR